MLEQQNDDVRYFQFGHYEQLQGLTHGVFTRLGGYSEGPYASLNTSTPPRGVGGDSVENVVRNRMLALSTLGLEADPAVTLWQVHGADVITFDSRDEWRTDWGRSSYYERPWTANSIRKGDALITQEIGTVLALSFADCTPIMLYDAEQRVIGIAHGGWRGTARGIVMATVEAMCERYGCLPQRLYAGIGPAIGACCYEVSETVRNLFTGKEHFDTMPTREEYRGRVRESAVFSTRILPDRESLRLDLQETNRQQLLMAGLLPEHIEVMEICTSCRTDLFFSHRSENGKTGRFVVIMALNPS